MNWQQQKKQILIVEDNDINRIMLGEILSDEYQVLEAENGKVALDILMEYRDKIDLILLDMMMPVMDGYTFLDEVKQDEELALIPVIVMTQGDSEEDEVSALAHGATDFVPKPYRPRVILHRVASIIKLRETAAMINQFQYDQLTGMYSKEFFYQKIREVLDANPDKEYTIVCSNIENFKLYNDTFGREAGDRLLKESAKGMQMYIGDEGICGRYGADRFMCMREIGQEKIDRAHIFGSASSNIEKKIDNLSVKWGIYEITDRTIPVEKMCDRALLAAENIKGQYNIPYAVYDDNLRNKLLREKAITDAMEKAIKKGEFIVYYQPKYSLNDDCMSGAEALVRWVHPEWGFMNPGEFIPLFEKNGFIPSLDKYIWEQVCIKLREWKEKGYALLPVSVNISRADVYQLDLADTLLTITQKYGVDPAFLHLEITESAYADNPNQIIATVDNLRKLGFIVEMDDFGSGYSSLNMLNQMKIDVLKLDMEFMRNEMKKPSNQSILRFVVSMAHWMNLSVVAEGVETKAQVERLREIGCDYVQGYYFAKPVPVNEFEDLLKKQKIRNTIPISRVIREEKERGKILLIDEDADYREKVQKSFEGQYDILEASDADSALDCIADAGSDAVSAVILSMTLPEDGAVRLLKVLREDPVFWKIPVLSTIPGGEVVDELPMTMETEDFLCKCHPQIDMRRRVERMIRVAEYQERQCTLQDQANRDYLTGLLNRRGLWTAIDYLRSEDLPLVIMLFDLDNLKEVNDTWGHEKGDQMLQVFTELLRSQTRSDDILCRYGGDEFLVILKHLNNEKTAMKKGSDICRLFCEQFDGGNISVSCSAGIAISGIDEKPSEKLIECADKAMYRAKQENKGGCCMWGSDI